MSFNPCAVVNLKNIQATKTPSSGQAFMDVGKACPTRGSNWRHIANSGFGYPSSRNYIE